MTLVMVSESVYQSPAISIMTLYLYIDTCPWIDRKNPSLDSCRIVKKDGGMMRKT